VIRRTPMVITLLVLGAATASAQIIRPVFRSRPAAWTSLAIGWTNQQGFCDRDSGDCYDFGSGPQWRASLEMPFGYGGTTLGIVGTIAKTPLIYRGTGLTTNSCLNCDADATVSQIFGVVRMGGSSGFHQVIDLSAGTTMFSNFRATNGGAKLGSGKMTQNFSFGVAYGFGYGFSPRAQVFFTQEYALEILPRQSGNANNYAQQTTLRIGGRYGLGGR
jgi:hypothetical protein